jgi:hypothetical protein
MSQLDIVTLISSSSRLGGAMKNPIKAFTLGLLLFCVVASALAPAFAFRASSEVICSTERTQSPDSSHERHHWGFCCAASCGGCIASLAPIFEITATPRRRTQVAGWDNSNPASLGSQLFRISKARGPPQG